MSIQKKLIFGLCSFMFCLVTFSVVEAGEEYGECGADDRFIDFEWYVLDKVTGLMWSQCFFGVPGIKCDHQGELVTNEDAQRVASEFQVGGKNSWRLPRIDELRQFLVSLCYEAPGQSSEVIPLVLKKGLYWSASQSNVYHRQYWAFDFGDGTEGMFLESNAFFLLVVHDRTPEL